MKNSVSEGNNLKLYRYQEKAVDFLRGMRRAYLFGEMGIGKTPIALRAIEYFPALVVVPNYLKRKWLSEAQRWLGDVDAVITGGQSHSKACVPGHDVYIANYESVRAKFDDYVKLGVKTVIWDESHILRNRKSQISRRAFALSKNIPVCWMLTGSAFVTGPADLWQQFRILFPQRYTSYWRWCEQHLVIERTRWGTTVGRQWAPYSNIAEEVKDFLLKIRRKDVLPELPEKTRETVEFEPSPLQIKVAKEIEDYHVFRSVDGSVDYLAWELERQTRLLQVAVTPALIDSKYDDPHPAKFVYVLEQLDAKVPIIVFARQVRLLDMLYSYILSHRPETVICRQDGKHDGAYDFQDGRGDILLAQTDSAKYGLDLHRTWRAIFLECPWTYADITQLEDRMLRPGQHNAILSTFLVTTGMKDVDVVEIVRDRRLAYIDFIRRT